MDATFLRKTFALIAKGLVEKEQLLQKEPTRYPYSKALQHGINMFLAASHQIGGMQDITQYADEAAFLKFFITKPVFEWFDKWDPNGIDSLNLKEEPFYSYGALAYQRSGNLYSPSSECYEYLESQDNDIMDGTDERVLYEKIIVLGQEIYCRIRRYIIEHPTYLLMSDEPCHWNWLMIQLLWRHFNLRMKKFGRTVIDVPAVDGP